MDKYFVCLANSYKRGGRCLAGVEITPEANGQWTIERHQNGSPRWIRPIAKTEYGEIPNHIAENIRMLSIIKLTDVRSCPECAHSENVSFYQMEVCPLAYPAKQAIMNLFVDVTHQSVFGNRSKAISSDMLSGLHYSLMLIHVENAQAYIDENREKSKNRMKFAYYGAEYDFPITDPTFLELFRKQPEQYAYIPDAYLTISLGLEFEGWHHKLVAGVIIPTDAPNPNIQHTIQQETTSREFLSQDWFDDYERELAQLLDKKTEIEERISELRQKLLRQMENYGIDKVHSNQLTVFYTPAKTVMQFDSRAFKTENAELYSSYCKPKQREASIVVKRMKIEDE